MLTLNSFFARALCNRLIFRAVFTLLIAGSYAGVQATPTLVGLPVPTTQSSDWEALKTKVTEARESISRWLNETPANDEYLATKSQNFLSARIEHRFKTVGSALAEYRSRHPENTEAESVESQFLAENEELLTVFYAWEAARMEEPASAAPWNQLAHDLLHNGMVVDALVCFEKSLTLLPPEPEMFSDFATCLLLYRSDAMRHYKLTEQEVFDKVLRYYRHAMRLEPQNFRQAVAYAEAFYLIKPVRPTEALAAWEHAYSVAATPADRGEALIHLARYAINRSRPYLARVYLDQVTDDRWDPTKTALLRRIEDAAKLRKPPSATVQAPLPN